MQETDSTGFHTGLTCFKDDGSAIVLRKGTVRLVVRKARRVFRVRRLAASVRDSVHRGDDRDSD